jgi:Holliday junction resolvase RusA-like endonuclease
MSMELTRVTKLLLWLLSKRPDIDNIGVREADPMDYLQDPELDYSQDQQLAELYAELSPDEQRLLQIEYFEDCLHRSIDDSTA